MRGISFLALATALASAAGAVESPFDGNSPTSGTQHRRGSRGNRAVQRAAVKRKNQARNRRAHRG